MDAIVTKYHGPTNSRGARISGTCGDKRVYVSYQYLANHERAARAILAKVQSDRDTSLLPCTFAELGHGFVYIFDLSPKPSPSFYRR